MSRGGWKDRGLLGWMSEDGAADGGAGERLRGLGEVNPCEGNAEGNEGSVRSAGCETCRAGRAAGIRSLCKAWTAESLS